MHIYVCITHSLSIYICMHNIYNNLHICIYIHIYIHIYIYTYIETIQLIENNKHTNKNTNSDNISIRWSRTILKEHIKSPADVSLWWFGEPSISWAIGSIGAQLGTCARAVATLGHRHRGDLEKTAAVENASGDEKWGKTHGTKQQET